MRKKNLLFYKGDNTMISVNDFRTGTTVEYENNIWQVIEFQHVKPGKGAACVRTNLRKLTKHNIQKKTFRPGEKLKRGHIDKQKTQYIYVAGSTHTFMDVNRDDQIELQTEQIKEERKFIKETMQ